MSTPLPSILVPGVSRATADEINAPILELRDALDAQLASASTAVARTSGTGAPEGVVTLPDAAEYVQTDATDGRPEWVKPVGTGLSAVGYVRKYTEIQLKRHRVSDTASTTQNNAGIAEALVAAANEGVDVTVHRTAGPIQHDATFTLPDNVSVVGDAGRGVLQQMQTGAHGLVLGNGNTLRRLRLIGVSGTVQDIDVKAISAIGASAASPLIGVTLDDVQVDSWGMYGVYLKHVQQFTITGYRATNLWYAGIATLSAMHGTIDRAYIDTVNAPTATNAYGMAFSREQLDSLTLAPRSYDILVSNSIVRNVPGWEGFDTHGGEKIRFVACHALGCYVGFLIGGSLGATAGIGFAPLDCHLAHCLADSLRDDGLASYGVAFVGVGGTLGASVEKATGSLVDVTVRRHGTESAGTSGGFYFHDTFGLEAAHLIGDQCSPTVLQLANDNAGFDIDGVVMIDTWTNSLAASTAVSLTSDYQTGRLDGIAGLRGSKSATHVNDNGIKVANTANNLVKLGVNNNLDAFTTPLADTGGKATTVARAAMTFKKLATFEAGLVSSTDIDATGGFRHTIDGWYQTAIPTTQAYTKMSRLVEITGTDAGEWIAPLPGSILGCILSATPVLTAGTASIRIYKNGSYILGVEADLTSGINGGSWGRNVATKDAFTFAAGDRIDLRLILTSVAPTGGVIRGAMVVEI